MSQSSSRVAAARKTVRPRAGAALAAGRDAGVAALLERLTRLKAGPHRIVSCYLKLEPRDRARGKFLIKLKNRVKAVAKALPRLGLERSVQEAVERDLARIQEHLASPAHLPDTQGIALFACEALKLFEVAALPTVHRSRLAVDASALVKELAYAEDAFGRVVTVVVDRTRARFFDVRAFGCVELPGLEGDATRGRYRGNRDANWGEHNYHNRIREEKQRHFETVARALFALNRAEPVHGIVLAGPGPEANAVEPFLHQYLFDRLLGTVHLNPKEVTPALVHEATLAVREAFDRSEELILAGELEEAWGAKWAHNGVSVTLKALARGQVRMLLVPADSAMPGFRCSDTGRLVLTEREGRGEGELVPVLDVIDDAIEEALRQHVDVRVLYEAKASAQIEGLAALLRFR